MERSLVTTAPYFDTIALREELTACWRVQGGDTPALKQQVVARLKALLRTARQAARQGLEADGNGRRCAEGLSLFQDELIRLIYDFATIHVYRAQNPSAAERLAIVATGGYGRGMMAPGSDVDLLFLLPYKKTAWGESVAEYVLYMLWDLGFKVGHATRTVEQCLRLARADFTIRTALLDARLILGEANLFDTLRSRFAEGVMTGTQREFIAAKLEERDRRHQRSGASRYRVEPNIKEAKGGLRDLHTLYWIAKYLHPELNGGNVAETGVFSGAEARIYRSCEDFLWTIRCHLHFLAGKAEERLTFDVQPVLAERLGYHHRHGLMGVERFMKHYFLVAKEVGDLTRILCSSLEVQQLKTVPTLNSLLSTLTWRRRAKLSATSDFRIDNGRLTVKHRDVFRDDPVNIIRLFAVAQRHKVLFHPDALRLVRASLRLIDDDLRANLEANRLFMAMLASRSNPEVVLRRMNEAGVLGRFIPDFGRVVSMMQFNMYHHFTVDEHLLLAVGILSDIEQGVLGHELPLSTEIIQNIDNRRALYLAMFLHDIAKGRREDHSLAGARIARELGPRLGLTPAETETAAWLVEHHLVMSQFAQSRDLNDPKTIRDFADIVQSRERLKLLVILTAADIRAVGPGVWTGWKGQLLRQLYYETEPLLAGGHTSWPRERRIAEARQTFREALADWPAAEVEAFIHRHHPAYWLKTELDRQIAHARLIRRAGHHGVPFVYDLTTDAFTALTELTLFTRDRPRLIATIAGACSAAGANIIGANLSTTTDGMALNVFSLQRALVRDEEELDQGRKIAETIRQLLAGERCLDRLMARKRRPKPRLEAFSVRPQVVIDNTLSDELTVIEVNGLDRPGLLYDITSEIADLDLDISSAHVATFGEKAVDVFYVTGPSRRKIGQDSMKRQIRERLLAVLGEEMADV